MEQQLDNLATNKYKDVYEEYIVKHNKFNFFKKPLKPYVPESSAFKYALVSTLFLALATGLNSSSGVTMVANVLTSISYISSIFFAVQSYFKFKEWSFSKGITPLSQPITLAIVALMLATMPTFMTVASEATWSSGYSHLNHPALNKVSI